MTFADWYNELHHGRIGSLEVRIRNTDGATITIVRIAADDLPYILPRVARAPVLSALEQDTNEMDAAPDGG